MSNSSSCLQYVKPLASSFMVALFCSTSTFAIKLEDKPLETLEGSTLGQKVLYRDGTPDVEKGSSNLYKSFYGPRGYKVEEILRFKAPFFACYGWSTAPEKGSPFWLQLPKMTVDTFSQKLAPTIWGDALTQKILQRLHTYNLKSSDTLDFSFHAQSTDNPGSTRPLVFRPHYLVHPQATQQGFEKDDYVDWTVYNGGDSGLDGDKVQEYSGVNNQTYTHHLSEYGFVAASPNNMHLPGLLPYPAETLSILKYTDHVGNSKVAVTYHWLLPSSMFDNSPSHRVQNATAANSTLKGILKDLEGKDSDGFSFNDEDYKHLFKHAKALANLELDDFPGLEAETPASTPTPMPTPAPAPAPNKEVPAVKKVAPAPVSKPAPVVKKAAPAVKKPAPVVKKAAPAVKKPAPVVKKAAPAIKKAAPAVKKAAPVVKKVVQTTKKVVKVAKKAAPAVKKAAPVVKKVVQTTKKVVKVAKKAAPSERKAASVVKKAVQVTKKAAPAKKKIGELKWKAESKRADRHKTR